MKISKKTPKIIKVEYWFDGITSSYQVTKRDFYNSYLKCFSKFRVLFFDNGEIKYA